MKKTTLVVVLALVLTIAFAASASATTGKFYQAGVDYYKWNTPTASPSPGTAWNSVGLSGLANNAGQGGPHAGYLATTSKCGICHSVHRANGNGVKLLPTADATCAGCHTGSTAVTAKVVTWGVTNMNWRLGDPQSTEFSFGGAGPHNDTLYTLWDDGEWDGIVDPPLPSYDVDPFSRYGCATRRCHATNPHGANSSQYGIFAAKLLFNDSPADDDATNPDLVVANGAGTYGGLDAKYDAQGATDASVSRFVDQNAGIVRVVGTTIEINKDGSGWRALDGNETHAIVAGLTCGRPSNPATGEDECHAEASYAIVDKDINELRNHATKITGNDGTGPAPAGENNAYRTDNTGAEWVGFGGNDNRDLKTGHVAGTFGAVNAAGSYVAIAGCTSCHDQTDSANTVAGNFTFPHGQTPVGTTNALTELGASGTMQRSRIWSGWAGYAGATKTITSSTTKAFDGQCLKCHRDATNTLGIGFTN
jgi:hypothetical protein